MSYKSETISSAINSINVIYFLPSIQREFVWDPEQIIDLFDSIMNRYPIGSLLFWKLENINKNKWEIYKFLDNAKKGSPHHNPIANTAGANPLILVLDGQQRLTSMLIGLRGFYDVKKRATKKAQESWIKNFLYIDLLHDPKSATDEDTGATYSFKWMNKAQTSKTSYWFKVGDILDFNSENSFLNFKYRERKNVSPDKVDFFEINLDRLYQAVWKDEFISSHTETDQDYDRVLEIFVRANNGGTKLSKSDLMLSTITSIWGDFNAREEIYSFVEKINNDKIRKNNFDKDFIMKTCLFTCDIDIAYKVSNFNKKNINTIKTNWDLIKKSIESATAIINTFGLDRDTLISANAIIPLIHYIFLRGGVSLQGNSKSDVDNSSKIRKWLLSSLLNGVFTGHSDLTLSSARDVINKENSKLKKGADFNFPVEALNQGVKEVGRTSKFDENTIDNYLDIEYGKKNTFLALSILYERNNWGVIPFHQDHIFPKSLFSDKNKLFASLSDSKKSKYLENVDNICNLQLLTNEENQEKSNRNILQWLSTNGADVNKFMDLHLLPKDTNIYSFKNPMNTFELFIEKRQELIESKLKKIF